MTIISKSHKRFSWCLDDLRVLSNPEEFLGPNFEAVLNFWLILDELTEKQLKDIKECNLNFYINQRSEWRKARNEAIKVSDETIGRNFAGNAADAVWDVYYGFSVAYWATKELIGMHLLLDQQKPLTFFQMFLEVL